MYLKLFILGCAIVMLNGCEPRPHVPPPSPGIPLQEICERYHVQWQWDGVTQVVLLEYRGNKAKALVGSRTVLVGREKIELSSPLRRDKSIIYVPEDFEAKVLAPFGVSTVGFPQADLSVSQVRTVVIDAGHGGKDPGAKGVTHLLEKDVNLDIARRTAELLRSSGLKVTMTRDADVFVPLPQRTEMATQTDADVFVSIHANSSPTKKVQGIEVYYVRTDHKKDLDEPQRQKNEKNFVKRLKARFNPVVMHVVADMMYQRKVENSKELAQKMSRTLSQEANAPDRGAKPCRFAVVRNTLVPAVLIEVGYLTHREEERRLNTASYRQKIAEAIAHSILNYANDSG